jgi:hypothetical protein
MPPPMPVDMPSTLTLYDVAGFYREGNLRRPRGLPRFHTPLIEPDVRIARIRLSDKTGLALRSRRKKD